MKAKEFIKKDKYRFDQYGSVYVFDASHQAYIFIGKMNGNSKKKFIDEYEQGRGQEDERIE
jgi:hypothetical protein